MGIFTRLFKGGQDGTPTDPTAPEEAPDTEPVLRVPPEEPTPEPSKSMWDWPDATPGAKPVETAPPPPPARPPTEEPVKPKPPPAPRPAPPVVATPPPAPKPEPRNDATMVMSPPPPSKPAKPPTVTFHPPRAKADSINSAFEELASGASTGDGVSTEKDLEEVRALFKDVAAIHVAQVRDVMLELHYGDASASWIEATKPALRSLRAMAEQMELGDLCTALDAFCTAVDQAVGRGATIGEAEKAALVTRYQTLIELIPHAFELDAERDRREPIIVESLLFQVDGVEKRTIEKLFAVGLGRLDALLRAKPDEMAAVAGLRPELARAIADKLKSYREAAASAVAATDPSGERKHLGDLLLMMSVHNDELKHASDQWSDAARAKKREARKQREQIYQQIKVSLARLGARDELAKLEKLPFDERIAQLDRYLTAQMAKRT